MSDMSQGPGWWLASDGKWYAPELHPDRVAARGEPDAGEVVALEPRAAAGRTDASPAARRSGSSFADLRHGEQIAVKEKVRGMNAALAVGGGKLVEAERRPMHVTRRQLVMALCLLLAAVVGAVLTLRAVAAGDQTFPAVVSTAATYNLDFPNTGLVTAVLVKSGQRVHAGQILAQQDTTSLQANVSADQAIVKADEAAITQAQSPQQNTAQQTSAAQQVQQAQTAVQNAQSALASAQALDASQVAAAQSTVTSDQGLVQADQARLSQNCPNGVPPPPANPNSGLEQTYLNCQNLQQQLDRDKAQLATAQAQQQVVGSQAQQNVAQQSAAVASAEAELRVVESQVATQSAPSTPATLAQDQANLTQAEANLSQAETQLAQATIVAPASGVVAQVSGAPGQLLGPEGVRQYGGPAALPQTPGFQLFPSTPSTPSGQTTNTSAPLIQLDSGEGEVVAQVPEASVRNFHVGKTATVTVNALNNWSSSAKVKQVVLSPTHSSSVTYNVVFVPDHAIPGVYPGMSATVS